MNLFRRAFSRTTGAVVVTAALAASFTALVVSPPSASGQATVAGQVEQSSHAGNVAAGRVVNVPLTSQPTPPTAAQMTARTQLMALHQSLPAPPLGAHTTAKDVTSIPGPATAPSSALVNANSFDVAKNVTIPKSCTTDCAQSAINEPDTAAAGADIMQTSNWDIAYSTNGGTTWSYQDPYLLQSGFCCDQTVVYQPSRDRFLYSGLDSTGFTIAETPSRQPTAWCVYQFTPGNFGGASGDLLDYPKIGFANNDLYVTWNEYTGSKWDFTGLARLPLDSLAGCGTFGFDYITRTDTFTFGLTGPTSSLDTFYWVSNWYTNGTTNGTKERIYYWPENSTSYFFVNRAINAYAFGTVSCASPDGSVTNWCSHLDPRWETPWISRAEYRAQANSAFAGDAILGVAIQAGPSSFSNGTNYVVYEYFKLGSLSYVGNDETYNGIENFAYAGCAVSEEGYVGCIESYGGGTSNTKPATFLLLQDNISPTEPWASDFVSTGVGNASAWGDYMVAQPYQPEMGMFIGTGWIVDGTGKIVPSVYVWGRGNAAHGYNRWK
jgi:hypothetical protein